jgi:hypothetical protein
MRVFAFSCLSSVFVDWFLYIYIHLLSETVMIGKGQKCAGGAIIGGQSKECG